MATYRKLLKNRNGDTIIPVIGMEGTTHLACWATRSSASASANVGTKISLTTDNKIYDPSCCSISNGIITLQPGIYLCSLFGRWGDLTSTNSAFLSFSVNGANGDDPYGIWSSTNKRLTQQVFHIFEITEATTLGAYVFTEQANSMSKIRMDIIKLSNTVSS